MRQVSAEVWAVIGVGIALGGSILPTLAAIRRDVARLEGLIEGAGGARARTRPRPATIAQVNRLRNELAELRGEVGREVANLRERLGES